MESQKEEKKRRYKIMVIDDDEFVLDTLDAGISMFSKDFEVIRCKSGSEGLKILGDSIPDVVVLDLGLPDINGIEMVRKLKKQINHIPIIILSGNDEPAKKAEAMDAGASDYYMKPIHPIRLIKILKKYLDENHWN